VFIISITLFVNRYSTLCKGELYHSFSLYCFMSIYCVYRSYLSLYFSLSIYCVYCSYLSLYCSLSIYCVYHSHLSVLKLGAGVDLSSQFSSAVRNTTSSSLPPSLLRQPPQSYHSTVRNTAISSQPPTLQHANK